MLFARIALLLKYTLYDWMNWFKHLESATSYHSIGAASIYWRHFFGHTFMVLELSFTFTHLIYDL